MTTPFELVSRNPTPLPQALEAPSICSTQVDPGSGSKIAALPGLPPSDPWSVVGHSTIKSARTWAFKAGRGRYCMSNSLSLIAHFANHPDVSGRRNIALKGWSVRTTMACA